MTEDAGTDFETHVEATQNALINVAGLEGARLFLRVIDAINAAKADPKVLLAGIRRFMEMTSTEQSSRSPQSLMSDVRDTLARHDPLAVFLVRHGSFTPFVKLLLTSAAREGNHGTQECIESFLERHLLEGIPAEVSRRGMYTGHAQWNPTDVGSALGLILKRATKGTRAAYLQDLAFLGALAGLDEYRRPIPNAPNITGEPLALFVGGLLRHDNPPEHGLAPYATAAREFVRRNKPLLDTLAACRPEALLALLETVMRPLMSLRDGSVPDTEADLAAKEKLARHVLKAKWLKGLAQRNPGDVATFLVGGVINPDGLFGSSDKMCTKLIRQILVGSPGLMKALFRGMPEGSNYLIAQGFSRLGEIEGFTPPRKTLYSPVKPQSPLLGTMVLVNVAKMPIEIHFASVDKRGEGFWLVDDSRKELPPPWTADDKPESYSWPERKVREWVATMQERREIYQSSLLAAAAQQAAQRPKKKGHAALRPTPES